MGLYKQHANSLFLALCHRSLPEVNPEHCLGWIVLTDLSLFNLQVESLVATFWASHNFNDELQDMLMREDIADQLVAKDHIIYSVRTAPAAKVGTTS